VVQLASNSTSSSSATANQGTISAATAACIWVALLLSLPLHARIALGSRELGVSVFDPILACVWLWLVLTGRLHRIGWHAVGAIAVCVAAVLLHDAAILLSGLPVQPAGMIRETIKYAAFPVLVGMVASAFSLPPLRAPPTEIVAACLVGIAAVLLIDLSRSQGRINYRPEESGIYANVVVAMLVLAMLAAKQDGRRWAWGLVAVSGAIALGITLRLFAKSLAAGVLAIGLAFTLRHAAVRFGVRGRLARLALVLAAAGVALAAIVYAFDVLGLGLGYDGTTARSVSIREVLWLRAADLLRGSFPLGIGLGQFGAQPQPVTDAFGQAQLFVHNTALAMVTELGALGVLGVGALLLTVCLSLAALSPTGSIAAGIYLAISFLLNEGLGYRGAILIIGLGLASRAAPSSQAGAVRRHR